MQSLKQLKNEIELTQKILFNHKNNLHAHRKYLRKIIHQNRVLLALTIPFILLISSRINRAMSLNKGLKALWNLGLFLSKN